MDAGGGIGEGVNTSGAVRGANAPGGAAGIGGFGAAITGAGVPANGAPGAATIGVPRTGGGGAVEQGDLWQQCWHPAMPPMTTTPATIR
jgi:hypothetical protein